MIPQAAICLMLAALGISCLAHRQCRVRVRRLVRFLRRVRHDRDDWRKVAMSRERAMESMAMDLLRTRASVNNLRRIVNALAKPGVEMPRIDRKEWRN